MESLLEPTSNKLYGRRSNAYAGNPVKEILLNLNLPDHSDLPYEEIVRNPKKDRSLLVFRVIARSLLGSASDETGKKKGRTVTLTTKDMQKRKNDATKKTKKSLLKQQYGNFKADGSETLEQTFNRLLALEWLMHTIVWRNRSDLDTMSLDDLYNHLKIDEDDMEEMDIKWNMALLSMRADRMGHFARDCRAPRSQDRGRRDNYKQGLAEHKSREVTYCEKIRVLEFNTESRANCIESLTKDLELLKKEKGELDTKLTGFQTASKDLDSLLESQRLDKNKEGLGYSAVPPPPTQIYSPPKKDMSWTGLSKCADDTVTDYSRPASTKESFPDDAQNKNPSITETEASPSTISPKPFIKFVKANDSPTKSKTDKVETAKKPPVKYAE
nr:hypothetical protein [Tanacetum cinerariifolium]